MKRPTVASLKKVTPENLIGLGVDRLAEILVDAAAARPELKRRLRMELAAAQGGEHLAVEIDRRLGKLETSRSKVSWRQRPTFVRDLEGLRVLIAERLAGLDRAAALDRLWLFMEIARRVGARVRDRDGELAAVFARAADNIGDLLSGVEGEDDIRRAAAALVAAIVLNPAAWSEWLPAVLARTSPALAAAALRAISERTSPVSGWAGLVRALADAAGDIDAFRSTYAAAALKTPAAAAEIARRLLTAQRFAEAEAMLKSAKDGPSDFDWESVWIDLLDQTGRAEAAQAARWASFERTLSAERARDFTRRLADFDDVEAETRAFELAAAHSDVQQGLQFLMDWPALAEAARMIQARADDLEVRQDLAEAWAAKLRVRQPTAALLLLRRAAAAAFRRRDFATCDRLTAEADALDG